MHIEDLHGRVQRGAYRALPSQRVYFPKPDGRQRPVRGRRARRQDSGPGAARGGQLGPTLPTPARRAFTTGSCAYFLGSAIGGLVKVALLS